MKTYEKTVSPDRLNPMQFLVHHDFLDGYGGDNSDYDDPVSVWPTESGRYNIYDGTHRAYDRWLQGEDVDITHPHPVDTGGAIDPDSPLRMEDVVVVHPGQEGEPIDVGEKAQAMKDWRRKHRYDGAESDDPVWHV